MTVIKKGFIFKRDRVFYIASSFNLSFYVEKNDLDDFVNLCKLESEDLFSGKNIRKPFYVLESSLEMDTFFSRIKNAPFAIISKEE